MKTQWTSTTTRRPWLTESTSELVRYTTPLSCDHFHPYLSGLR